MARGFGARRIALKTAYALERARARVRSALRLGPATVPLSQVQRRLEIVLGAVYGRHIPIAPIEQNVWTRERVRQFAKGDIRGADAMPGVDGQTIYLPPELATRGDERATVARYRLFAIEQAERIARGTAALAPLDDPLERDLYLLREGAAIDAEIARKHPGVRTALGSERRSVLARRPKVEGLTDAERDVELLVREALSTEPEGDGTPSTDPAASLAWARATAARIRKGGARYRGLPPASIWGTVRPTELAIQPPPGETSKHRLRTGNLEANPQESSSGEASGAAGRSAGEPPPRDDGANDGDLTQYEAAKEMLAGAESQPAPESAGATIGGIDQSAEAGALDGLPPAIWYDEWNANKGVYVKHGAAVRLYEPELGDAAWARETLQSHAALVRQIRQQFERLRARRTLLSRQRSGDELDIDACVDAMIDRRLGSSPDDRLYLDARPARRGVAIALVADTSGSTEQRVTDAWRIIDLEKIALLLAGQALDALGDLYAVYAFAGKGAANVRITVVKDFAERSGETMNRRIAALAPGGFTRLGAAVRHATRQLARQSAGHRLLLLLSDGRPNDVDLYQGSYGVDDARQAIFEARASGVFPFCLTIDRDASEYLPRIFGQAGHTILQRPQQLPTALLTVVRSLIKR